MDKSKTSYVVWKAMVLDFPVVGKWLVWKVGYGSKVKLGEDPWTSSDTNHRLPSTLVNTLRSNGLYFLNQVGVKRNINSGRQEWLNVEDIELEGKDIIIWKAYIDSLRTDHVGISN